MRDTLISRTAMMTTLGATLLTGCAGFSADFGNPLDRFSPKAAVVDTQLPQAPAQDWVAESYKPDALPSTNWVAEFGDPTLLRIINTALIANPDIRAARARLDAAEQSAIIASQGLLPGVSASGGVTHSEFGDSRIGDSNRFDVGINASWEADLWGRVRDTANAGELEAGASEADYFAARLSITGQAATAWFDLIEARLQTELSERNLQTQNRALNLTERRFFSGLTTSADVRIARSSVASAEASLASRKQAQSSGSRRVEVLLRDYPSAQLEASTDLPALPPVHAIIDPQTMLTRRPDLIAAETRMAAQGLRVDIARKNLLPKLTLSGDVGLQVGDISDLLDIDGIIASIVGGLTAPIFQAGALKAEVKRNEAVLRQQVESYVNTVLTAYLDVENALDAERRLDEREAALRVALEEARQAELRLERQYSQGLINFLPLLDAQSRAINAESALISARKERLANRVRLHLALGGGTYGAPTDILVAQTLTGNIAGSTPR
ncbi:efflux transporter outer membrane subunit [Robiginitomaculum antarcticum]|uniref:efflux transporter outer membrane subunit n=1 Tax=Robiginitomaculum antarcticum TaxID=437507 RepID=UPI0003A27EDB|nr:efflux transporter outer membrane subunit [Robiginitomaculum antarcticum]